MTTIDERLASIATLIDKGVAGPTETVRTLLQWFGVQRRGTLVVREIRKSLETNGLVTEPDFESTWIDGEITFVKKSATPAQQTLSDPTFRLGRLEAANKEVVSVSPNDSISKVVTLLLTNDFSQMPVMVGSRDVKGVVSWKSIGAKLSLGQPCNVAKDAMETAQVVSDDVSLLDAVDVISKFDYVLVQRADKQIGGIVTAGDFSAQFRTMSEPFLLVGEIENGIRHLLHGRFNKKELQAASDPSDTRRSVTSPSDLTFGEYIRLIESESNWTKLGLKIDRVEFVKKLDRVRHIRNDVMHFDPDGLAPDDKKFLSEFAQFLKKVREICN